LLIMNFAWCILIGFVDIIGFPIKLLIMNFAWCILIGFYTRWWI